MFHDSLERRLSSFDAGTIVVSDMIGSGIFFTTGYVLFNVGSGWEVLAAWAAGGLFALFGALSYAELAVAFPRAGGEYNYLKEAYGPLMGFLSGWTSLFVGFSAPIAIGALAFSKYLQVLFPVLAVENLLSGLPLPGVSSGTLIALFLVAALLSFHFLGKGADQRVQVVLTVLKTLAIVALVIAALASGHADFSLLSSRIDGPSKTMLAFAAGVVPITFSYSGWNAAAYIAGEVKNPVRDLPRALVGGTLLVTLIYLLVNVVYLSALPVGAIKGVGPVAEKTMTALMGSRGGLFVSGVICLSIVGAINAMLFIGPRVLYAMSRDNLFLPFAASVNERTGVPQKSLLALSGIAAVMIFLADLRELLEFAGFVLVVFSFLAVSTVLVLRRTRPELERPYRVWGYPATPLLFSAFSLYLMYSAFFFNLKSTLAGIAVVLAGVPAYLLVTRRPKT